MVLVPAHAERVKEIKIANKSAFDFFMINLHSRRKVAPYPGSAFNQSDDENQYLQGMCHAPEYVSTVYLRRVFLLESFLNVSSRWRIFLTC
jgi:hypothetical protein